MPRKICTKAPAPGWMGAPAPASSGLPIYVTGCGTATSSTCWQNWLPWSRPPHLPQSARQTLTNVYTYLKTHEDYIHYEHFKAAGLPIGSGLVESAYKWLIQQRFKRVGMRWSEAGFNHLLHLRLAWVTNDSIASSQIGCPPQLGDTPQPVPVRSSRVRRNHQSR